MRRGALLALAVAVVLAISTSSAEALDVYFINVGHGDAILVDCGEWEALIDAGGPTSRWCPGLSIPNGACSEYCIGFHIAFLSSKIEDELDLAILTHNHDDHFGGFGAIFDHFGLGAFYYGEMLAPNHTANSFDVFLQQLASERVVPTPLSRGDQIAHGGLLITVLNPEHTSPSNDDHNDNSVVLFMEYGHVAFLLTGDIQTPAERAIQLIDLPDRCLALKVAHHGSDSSTSRAFLDWADPEVAIVSCDSNDLHDQVAANLTQAGVLLFQTWSSGTIRVSTDGESIWVTTDTLSHQLVTCGED